MPLYEYKCDRCGETFEVMQKFSDDPLKVHEGCGGAVERLLSAPALQFKGSGWYVTDYAGKTTAKEGSQADSPGSDGSKESAVKESNTKESASKEGKDKKPAKKK